MGNNLRRLCIVDDDKAMTQYNNNNDFNLNDIHINPNYVHHQDSFNDSEHNDSNEGTYDIYI